jgi:hypothetical protein
LWPCSRIFLSFTQCTSAVHQGSDPTPP